MSANVTPEEADAILDGIAQGNFTKSRVAHDAEVPLLAYYLVLLAEKSATLSPGDPPGTCLHSDEMWKFIRAEHSFRLMAKKARHIGSCKRCKSFFEQAEKDV